MFQFNCSQSPVFYSFGGFCCCSAFLCVCIQLLIWVSQCVRINWNHSNSFYHSEKENEELKEVKNDFDA